MAVVLISLSLHALYKCGAAVNSASENNLKPWEGGGAYLFDVPFEVHVHTLSCFAIVSLHVFSSKPQECVHTHIQTSLRLLRTNTKKKSKEDDNKAAQHIFSLVNVDLDVSPMSVFVLVENTLLFLILFPPKNITQIRVCETMWCKKLPAQRISYIRYWRTLLLNAYRRVSTSRVPGSRRQEL